MSNPPLNIQDLQSDVAQGKQYEYIPFWSHRQKYEGVIDASCLSQWFPVKFEVGGKVYVSAEQYMMAEKAKLFHDIAIRKKILVTTSPREIKRLGREVKGFIPADWDRYRTRIVYEGNMKKFEQNVELSSFLRSTRNAVLVEASPYDNIWGVGLAENDAFIHNPLHWRGQNLLGFALMMVRNYLHHKYSEEYALDDNVILHYQHSIPKARKEHQCCECWGIIPVGKIYENVSGLMDDGWFVYKTCLGCMRLRDDLVDISMGPFYTGLDEVVKRVYGTSIRGQKALEIG